MAMPLALTLTLHPLLLSAHETIADKDEHKSLLNRPKIPLHSNWGDLYKDAGKPTALTTHVEVVTVTKRGDWEDAYNYAVTWDGTETAGGWEATRTGEVSVDFYGMPVSKTKRAETEAEAEASGGVGGSGRAMGSGQAQGKGDGAAKGDGRAQGKDQLGGREDGGEGRHLGEVMGQGQGQGQRKQHEGGLSAGGAGDDHGMGSGMPPKQGQGY